jgi:RsiW-degrading membrane proteinase PrsW (M82 family)
LDTAAFDVRRQVDAVEASPKSTLDDLLAALPGGRIRGAFLPRDTVGHWFFAGLVVTAFLMLATNLFPTERVGPLTLIGVGVFTATAGVVIMLTVQQIIGSTYRPVLDGDGQFGLSLCGYILGVGLIEEAAKALPLLWRSQRRPSSGWRTVCLWGLASGVGFGVAEGLVHAERSYNGLAGIETYLVRFASCVALHAVWTAIAGIGVVTVRSELEESREPAVYIGALLRVLAGPALLHGLYDVLLQYQCHAAALLAAVASFGWLAWRIEAARAVETSPVAVG